MIFWLKTRARWKEPAHELAAGDGAKLIIQWSEDDKKLL